MEPMKSSAERIAQAMRVVANLGGVSQSIETSPLRSATAIPHVGGLPHLGAIPHVGGLPHLGAIPQIAVVPRPVAS